MILIKKQQDIAENDIKEALIFFFFYHFCDVCSSRLLARFR